MNPEEKKAADAVHVLAAINRLGQRAFTAKTRQSLVFLMLNDTLQIVRYNQAVLWKFDGKPELIGVSGHAEVKPNTEQAQQWLQFVSSIREPEKTQMFSVKKKAGQPSNLTEGAREQELPPTTLLWLPIHSEGRLVLGMWLERWDGAPWNEDEVEVLNFLMKSYGAAWEKYTARRVLHPSKIFNRRGLLIGLAIIILLSFIPVPLRVVAPCEVVPEKVLVITTPLEGTIEKVDVESGQLVKKDDPLFQYDQRAPLEELRVIQKQVEIASSELNRAKTLAFQDKHELQEVGVLELKLKKALVDLELAQYRANHLIEKSPIDGVALIENPEEWRGRPVHIGDKVMELANPNQSKVHIWIAENDNVNFKKAEKIKIILDVDPFTTLYAILTRIDDNVTMSEQNLPVYVAEAKWVQEPKQIQFGLKGSATLYGEDVFLIYWILRRPISGIRDFFGW